MDAPTPSENAFLLPGVLDLTVAAPLARDILARRGAPLEIDASSVQRLGGQCLQVLLSAAALWQVDEMAFSVTNPSDRFEADRALFGATTLTPMAASSEISL